MRKAIIGLATAILFGTGLYAQGVAASVVKSAAYSTDTVTGDTWHFTAHMADGSIFGMWNDGVVTGSSQNFGIVQLNSYNSSSPGSSTVTKVNPMSDFGGLASAVCEGGSANTWKGYGPWAMQFAGFDVMLVNVHCQTNFSGFKASASTIIGSPDKGLHWVNSYHFRSNSVSGATCTGAGVVTLTTSSQSWSAGNVIWVESIAPAGYNAVATLTAATSTSASYTLAGGTCPGSFVSSGNASKLSATGDAPTANGQMLWPGSGDTDYTNKMTRLMPIQMGKDSPCRVVPGGTDNNLYFITNNNTPSDSSAGYYAHRLSCTGNPFSASDWYHYDGTGSGWVAGSTGYSGLFRISPYFLTGGTMFTPSTGTLAGGSAEYSDVLGMYIWIADFGAAGTGIGYSYTPIGPVVYSTIVDSPQAGSLVGLVRALDTTVSTSPPHTQIVVTASGDAHGAYTLNFIVFDLQKAPPQSGLNQISTDAACPNSRWRFSNLQEPGTLPGNGLYSFYDLADACSYDIGARAGTDILNAGPSFASTNGGVTFSGHQGIQMVGGAGLATGVGAPSWLFGTSDSYTVAVVAQTSSLTNGYQEIFGVDPVLDCVGYGSGCVRPIMLNGSCGNFVQFGDYDGSWHSVCSSKTTASLGSGTLHAFVAVKRPGAYSDTNFDVYVDTTRLTLSGSYTVGALSGNGIMEVQVIPGVHVLIAIWHRALTQTEVTKWLYPNLKQILSQQRGISLP